MSKLTQKRLKELLHYNPDTGIFTWLQTRGRVKAGNRAGSFDVYEYVQIGICNLTYKAHKLAWLYIYDEWPKEIDHENHVRSDNRINNLRKIKDGQNAKNQSLHKNNTSGCSGVHKNKNSWQVRIYINGVRKHIGIFSDKKDAILARKAAEKEHGYHTNHGT